MGQAAEPLCPRRTHMEQMLICLSIALIAGLLMSRLAKAVNLPAVTSYLVAGLLLGPFVLGAAGPQRPGHRLWLPGAGGGLQRSHPGALALSPLSSATSSGSAPCGAWASRPLPWASPGGDHHRLVDVAWWGCICCSPRCCPWRPLLPWVPLPQPRPRLPP